MVFKEITATLNFLFEYRNEGYEPLTQEWVEENISIRQIVLILEQVADQNQMGWLMPFFREALASGFRSQAQAIVAGK
ncbi:MAG: hypothetical protein IMZ71_02785 [Chloroflexi bacterium]|nr:hypothetical protein [Chloroflexota bacterium]